VVRRLLVTINLEYTDEKMAEAVAAAVSPDNFKTPVGLQIKTTRQNSQVVTIIQFEGKMATFTATIDDLLFSATTAEKALQAIRQNE
jgi:hypothetical protein